MEETGPLHTSAPRPISRWGSLTGKIALGVVSTLVLGVSGYAWGQYTLADSSIRKSGALSGEATSLGKDTNILIMGLDSRLDENGNPLPPDIYNALQAGNQNDGGNNSNVLMLLHVPGDGSKATSVSIPRDDYTSFPGCPDKQCKGKIKEAYGLAFAQKHDELVSQGLTDRLQIEQQSRDAGRKEEIDTVRAFVGGEPVDHFVEVTMVAFFQLANAVQPITVCLNEDTHDSFSQADFHKGVQQISAQQAVEFVRQRRDPNQPDFTELDRERRQQAFISSLAYQLKQGGTFANPGKLRQILSVGEQNIAVDSGLDLLSFAQQATNLTSGNIQFVTLPIQGNSTINGEDVNTVDQPKIQAMVHQLIGGNTPLPPAAATPSGTVDVDNASGQTGLAGDLEKALASKGYTQGTPSTDPEHLTKSSVHYSGDPGSATALANLLGIPTEQDSSVPAGHLKVVIGTDFSMPSSLSSGGSSSGSGSGGSGGAALMAPPPKAQAPAPAPSPSADPNSALSGGGIPCVK
jgi:LCP family protein required for cell wall assembly